jgi:hypothetical protein
MFPPRAESVDSFSHQRPPGDRSDITPSSESRGRTKGTFSGRGKAWTEKETELARQMLTEKKPESEFQRVLGRSKSQVYQRIFRLKSSIDSLDWLKLPMQKRVAVPPESWADASRRLNAPRTLSAWICGDPAPGYSALDQRMGGDAHVG